MTTFAIATLGCKVNTYESCGYQNALIEKGFQEVDFKEVADVYIINTCAVTNIAASKSRQKIHQAKNKNPNALIVVVGCYAQIAYDYLKANEPIDILIGSEGKNNLVNYIEKALKGEKVDVKRHDVRLTSVFEALPLQHFDHQTRAFLKIQDGCNQFCSYCIIPYARGKERSLAKDEVLKLARQLCNSGHKEIVLTGIHTGRYGAGTDCNLTQLLELLCNEVEGLQRIRLSSIEMNEISDEFLDLMKHNDKIARHLHIPLQAGCDTTLKNMNRPYDMKYYMDKIEHIRQIIPDISISSDVIVGFPNESEEDFVTSMNNIEKMKLSFLHVFPFSAKEGTKAASMKPQFANQVKKERVARLSECSERLYDEFKVNMINKKVKVLFEKRKGDMLVGHSSEYLEVYACLGDEYLNTIQEVIIDRYENKMLIAKEV